MDSDPYVQWQGNSAEPGGIYRVVMPNGAEVRGAYIAVEPPNRVVFTWGWEGDDTVLRLRHTGLPSMASRDQHAAGWHTFLAALIDRADPLP